MTKVESLTYVFYNRCGTWASWNTVFYNAIALLHFIEKHVASKKNMYFTRFVFFCKMRTPEHHPEKCFWGTYFTRNLSMVRFDHTYFIVYLSGSYSNMMCFTSVLGVSCFEKILWICQKSRVLQLFANRVVVSQTHP